MVLYPLSGVVVVSLLLIAREDRQKRDTNHKHQETDNEREDDGELEFRCYDLILPSLGRRSLHCSVSASHPAPYRDDS